MKNIDYDKILIFLLCKENICVDDILTDFLDFC